MVTCPVHVVVLFSKELNHWNCSNQSRLSASGRSKYNSRAILFHGILCCEFKLGADAVTENFSMEGGASKPGSLSLLTRLIAQLAEARKLGESPMLGKAVVLVTT